MTWYNLISLVGIFGLMGVAWIFSAHRRVINWRVVIWGLILPLGFAFFIFQVPAGRQAFLWINDAVKILLSFAKQGLVFVFGPLALEPGEKGSIGFILAFQALPTIIFFSALMALLYYFKIMSYLVKVFAWVFTKLMRISGAESLYVSSNIFVGVESAFTVRPYLARMTSSELLTILTMGMGSVASTVLAAYAQVLNRDFPMIAGHLVSASILSAPVSILISKLLLPETERPETLGLVVAERYERPDNWITAIINGAQEGVKLCVGIVALLIAFLGLLALVNWLLQSTIHTSLEQILGYLFYPLAALMGVPAEDIPVVAKLLGKRVIVTEWVAYQDLAQYIKQDAIVHPRSVVITAYALCGFAHIASVAIFVGGTAALVPERTRDLARIGFRALCAATLTCLMIGAIAGVFATGKETILGLTLNRPA